MKLVHHIGNILEKIYGFKFLTITLFIFFLLRLPSLVEPYWYGDEGIYQVIGVAMQQGRILYRDIWDNKPPLLYVLYELVSSDQFAIRLLSLLFGLAAIIAFFLLTRELFPLHQTSPKHGNGKKIAFFTTFSFAIFFGIPLLEGNIANSENFMLFPIIFAALLLFRYLRTPKSKTLIIAGFLLSLAFLFKIVGIFDFAAFSLFLLTITFKKGRREIQKIRELLPFFLSFAIPIIGVIFYFAASGVFSDFFNAAFKQNIGYVGYGNKLFIPQGLLLLKLFLLISLVIILFIKRHTLSKTALFIFLWFAFSAFNAFFSGRPYTHYMLVLLPSFLLLLGFILWNPRSIKEEINIKTFIASQRIGTIFFAVITLFVINNFWFYSKILPYYQNFFDFMTHKKSVIAYRNFFDRNTQRDYELAQFINLHAKKEDKLFIWGNNAQLYFLTNKLPAGRYTVAYHMLTSSITIKETQQAFLKEKPKFLIIVQQKNLVPFNLTLYRQRILIRDAIIYERVY